MSISNSFSEDDEFLPDDTNSDVDMDTGVLLTRLNEVVRKQYFAFLEKLLKENYIAWCKDALNQMQPQNHIKACAELLENKAVKACMMVQMYRKTMIKIIASVRRSTEQCRLQDQLHLLIEGRLTPKNKHPNETKSTQTESLITKNNKSIQTETNILKNNKSIQTQNVTIKNDDDFTSLSLQRKIENFQEKLNRETASKVAAAKPQTKQKFVLVRSKRKRRAVDTAAAESHRSLAQIPTFQLQPSPSTPITTHNVHHNFSQNNSSNNVKENSNVNDEVALELAQLFSEEKNEIDKMFGFDSNEEPDDPQINIILKEIENAKLPHEQNVTTPWKATAQELPSSSKHNTTIPPNHESDNKLEKYQHVDTSKNNADMRNSLWPCELYMQRRLLSETLSRLIEEDFRWNEVIKWKFVTLFGEDSEDEFASYSPTIELDEILMCSCVKRISPWVVKHLMKPMNDGLIANRFLFKKLAKKLSRSIISENQYPDERLIRTVVENFFCIRQAVISLEDLEMPFTLFNENI